MTGRASPGWPLPPVVSLSELGRVGGPISGESGQSSSVRPLLDHEGFLLKTFRVFDDSADAGRLDRLIALPGRHPDAAGLLLTATSWPVARVHDSEQAGCVIPLAPDRFLVTSSSAEGGTRGRYLEVDLLAMPGPALVRRGLRAPTASDRRAVVTRIVEIAATLERVGLVYSDWSYSNAFWSAQDSTAFVIDIDGCHFGSGPHIHQPNWEDPLTPRGDPADTFVDRYRVALLAARCLTGRRVFGEVRADLVGADRPCSRAVAEALLDALLAERRTERPSVATLRSVLLGGSDLVVPGRRRTLPDIPQTPVSVDAPSQDLLPPGEDTVTTAGSRRPWGGVGRGSRRRRVRAGLAALVLAAAPVLGYGWVQDRRSVGVHQRGVVVLRGVDVNVFGHSLLRRQSTDVDLALLPDTMRREVESGIEVGSEHAAQETVERLRNEAERCRRTIGEGCPTRTLRLPTLRAEALTYPNGNRVKVIWNGVDDRRNVTTMLSDDGGSRLGDCPSQLSGAGSCEFEGGWDQTHVVRVGVSAPDSQGRATTAKARTYDRPSVRVAPGAVFSSEGEDYCRVLVTITGLAPSIEYEVRVRDLDGSQRDESTFRLGVDERGNLAESPLEDFGYRDPGSVGWLSVTVEGITATRNPWGCPSK